jgi:hypothetical protein
MPGGGGEKGSRGKMEALEKMVDVIQKYGEIETMLKMGELQSFDYQQEQKEEVEKRDAKRTAAGNEFISKILGQPIMNSNQPGSQTPFQGAIL